MTDAFSLPSRYWRIVDTADGPRGYVEEDVDHEVGRTALLIIDALREGPRRWAGTPRADWHLHSASSRCGTSRENSSPQ